MSHKDVTSSFLFYPQHVAAAGWIFNFFVSAVRWREDICVWRWFSVIHHVCSCTWSFFSCGSKSHYNVWLKIYGRRPPDRSVMKQTYKDLWWCCMYCKYTCVCVLLESWLMWFWDWLCFSILHESTHRSLWSSIMMSENRLRRGDKGSGGGGRGSIFVSSELLFCLRSIVKWQCDGHCFHGNSIRTTSAHNIFKDQIRYF